MLQPPVATVAKQQNINTVQKADNYYWGTRMTFILAMVAKHSSCCYTLGHLSLWYTM